MTITIEVCIDNIESLSIATNAGAKRIELCSSLILGGLTPSAGFIKQAVKHSNVPVYAMVRARAGDFVFNDQEIKIMLDDIAYMQAQGISGIVIGALTATGSLNLNAIKRFICAANGMGVTFHRAFDLCHNPQDSLEQLIDLGCERILTSGLKATAEAGIEMISSLVIQANKRISIMPGCGVNVLNAAKIITQTGANEIHLSGKTTRPSLFIANSGVKMGNNAQDDAKVDITDFDKVRAIADLF